MLDIIGWRLSLDWSTVQTMPSLRSHWWRHSVLFYVGNKVMFCFIEPLIHSHCNLGKKDKTVSLAEKQFFLSVLFKKVGCTWRDSWEEQSRWTWKTDRRKIPKVTKRSLHRTKKFRRRKSNLSFWAREKGQLLLKTNVAQRAREDEGKNLYTKKAIYHLEKKQELAQTTV